MANEAKRHSPVRCLLREILGIGLPAVLAAGLFALLPADSRSQGDPAAAAGKTQAAPVCDQWHRGSGATSPLDVELIQRAYADLRRRVEKSLGAATFAPTPDLDQPYDVGLPACRAELTRTEALPEAQASRFRGKLLYFVAAGDPVRLRLPPDIEGHPDALILVTRTRRLADLPEIARSLGRPVSLGTALFAKMLGVRCANTWLKISEKGDGVELHEGP